MASKITFADKENTRPSVNAINEVRAEDLNEIKDVVNFHADDIIDIQILIPLKQPIIQPAPVVSNNFTGFQNGFYEVDASAGNILCNLNSPIAFPGRTIDITKVDNSSNTVTIVCSGHTINGESSIIIKYKNSNITLVSVNNNWRIR